MSTLKFFDTDLEHKILAGILCGKFPLEQMQLTLNTDYFYDETCKTLYDLICRFYRKYYRILSQEALEKYLAKHDPAKKTQLILSYIEVTAIQVEDQYQFYLDQLKALYTKRHLYKVYQQIQAGLETDQDPVSLRTSITRDLFETSTDTTIVRTTVTNAPEQREQLYIDKKAHPEKYKGVPYGMTEIDEITGGMYAGQLYLVTGRTGQGKSTFLFNVGCNVAKLGKTVMYCTIEMDAKMLQHMWEARESKLPLSKIVRAQLTPDEENLYFEFLKSQKGKDVPFYIVDIPQGATTGLIESEVTIFEKLHGKSPDVVLVDYANLIQPVTKYKDRTEKFDNVFRELHENARSHHTVYYTAAQQNREAIKAKKVGTEHVAFSDASSHHCDGVFNIHSTEQDELQHTVHFDTMKGRFHAKQGCILLWEREINYIGDWMQLKNVPSSSSASTSDESKDF